MKIQALRLKQFKKFDQPAMVEGFGDGLNLIIGPNETGKSTLLLALRAALFETHGSNAQAVKDFAPHHVVGAKPEISLSFEIEGKTYHLEKRFLKAAQARLETPGGKRFEGADAETELKRVLGLNPSEKTSTKQESPAHFGVLLTPQTHSFKQPDLAIGTRHSLEAAIAEDVAELGNQSEVDGLLAEVQAERAEFIDGRGKPKGRYKDVEARLKDIEADIDDLRRKRSEQELDIQALQQADAERQTLHVADGGDGLAERLAKLEANRTEAARYQVVKQQHLEAHQHIQQLRAKRETLEVRLEEQKRLIGEIADIEGEFTGAEKMLTEAEHSLAAAEKTLSSLMEEQDRLTRKQRDLEALGHQIERHQQIESMLKALATDVRFELQGEALNHITVDGNPLDEASKTVQVIEGLDIEIMDIGRITVAPKTDPMREALDARTEVDAAIARSLEKLDLKEAEPDGIEALWHGTKEEMETVRLARTEKEETLSAMRQHAAQAKATSESLKDRRLRQNQRMAELATADSGDAPDLAAAMTALDADIAAAEKAFLHADKQLKAASSAPHLGNLPPLEQLDADINTLRKQIESRRQGLEEAGRKVVALRTAIAVRSGLGLDEQIDQLERQRHLLGKERDGFALDHRTLSLLQTALKEAADEVKANFNAPLSARLTPYIQDLFGQAVPMVTPDFSIRALDRNGQEEPFLHLSDGTREQIAILARLAYSDMLQQQGLPALIVLDDALAFSDDERLKRMFAILEKAAKRMQIIILTCREDRFAGIDATRLKIQSVPEQVSPAA